jgi:hypothetical protein
MMNICISIYSCMYISVFTGVPQYGPLLSTTDSDAVAWCLSWSQGDSDKGRTDEEMFGRGRGGSSIVTFNLSSTRNLVARCINLLNTCQSSLSSERLKGKKTQCDALLVLCEMFVHV